MEGRFSGGEPLNFPFLTRRQGLVEGGTIVHLDYGESYQQLNPPSSHGSQAVNGTGSAVRTFLVLGSPLNISFLFRREEGRATMCIQIAYCNICNKHSSPTKSCRKAPPLKSSTPFQSIYCQMYVCQLKLSRKSKCYISTGTRAGQGREWKQSLL